MSHDLHVELVGVRRRLGVQQFSIATIVLLTLSASVAVVGLVWSSRLLEQTSADLVRAGEGLRFARDIEQSLYSHQRLTILAESSSSDTLATERSILEGIEAAREQAPNDEQAELLGALVVQAQAYFEDRAIIESDADAIEALAVARPTFDRALSTARSLARYHELELERANATAQRLGSLLRVVAVIAAAFALTLVTLISISVRAMILRPILAIRDALVRFRSGDYEAEADENIARELSEIAAAFNDMKTELARRRAERLAFLAGVAHDLRNPLSALKMGVAALETDQKDPKRVQHTLHVLWRQLDHLERMCGDLLEQSRVEAGSFELSMTTFDLRDAATAVADLYRPTAGGREIALELDAQPVSVTADRLRVEQVIGNLVKNAIKYSDEHARIRIGVRRRDDAPEVTVADNGLGIADDELEAIFRPFRHGSTVRSTGTGLGLSVVQRIVKAHGGSVRVESQVGAGSTFYVRLPPAQH